MTEPISTPPSGSGSITLSSRPAKKSVSVVVAAVIGLVGIGAGVDIGRATAPQQATLGQFGDGKFPRPNVSGGPGMGGGPGGGMMRDGGPSLSGNVETVEGSTVTMKLTNGKTVSFTIGKSTTVSKNSPAAATDVVVGANVAIQVQGAQLGQLFQGTTDNIDLGDVSTVTVK